MKIKYLLRILYHFIRGTIQPENVNHSVRVGNAICDSGVLKVTIDKIKLDPDGSEFLRRRNLFFNHGLPFFEKFPPGSFGRCYFDHLKKYNLDPNAFPAMTPSNDDEYIEYVIRQAHDILHVVTGFDVTIKGELGLQAFKAKQMNWPFAMIGIAGGCLVTLVREPKEIDSLIGEISRGYQIGAQAKPLILVDWNEKWAQPLTELRLELGITM